MYNILRVHIDLRLSSNTRVIVAMSIAIAPPEDNFEMKLDCNVHDVLLITSPTGRSSWSMIS